MSFNIIIAETKPVTKTVGKDWHVVGQQLKASERDPQRDVALDVYGYTPEIEKTVDVTTKVYEQTVEDLELAGVIKAVNKLSRESAPISQLLSAAPQIGSPWEGGIYAGVARGTPDCRLIVGEQAPKRMTWQQGLDWAKSIGNGWRLPMPPEQALCYANVPELFEKEWYWSAKPYEGDAGYAYAQAFGYGYQHDCRKDGECKVRLVRTISI